ncbi:VirB3 family type IV secretion system protein [Caballeronia sordidicola]|uniref:VirB3 family type IV secretion system protein n=1 Tax=Caballeronia sordidicola TaxID=196367 RepID=UPI00094C7AD3|nr:VirB3 family type IV secretion system protein [Caballeronia sordidicola]
MRESHEIPKGMVQPWMIWGCVAELFLGSFVLPASIFMFVKWWPVMLAVPVLLIASYMTTATDMFRLLVWYASLASLPKPRSLKNWGGAKTYVPR